MEIDWSDLYVVQDTNVAYEIFINKIVTLLDTHIPLVKKKLGSYKRDPRLPWVSKSLLRSINRKNNLYYVSKAKKTQQSRDKYTAYKNTLTMVLRKEKRNYYMRKLDLFKNDMRNTWKLINETLNKHKERNVISKIMNDGFEIKDLRMIAEIFNSHFSTVGRNLCANIPLSTKEFYDYLDVGNQNSIFFPPVTVYEILDIVHNLPSKRSSGYDDIDNILLKNIIPYIVDPLFHIFNLSISQGQVPDVMKISKIVPIFKKGNREELNNYRPISLLPNISKILEKIIYSRVIDFLNRNDILSKYQFGFRKKHSTAHAILSFTEKVSRAIDKFQHTAGIFLDLSKAFDMINHDMLLYKLNHYGIRGKALEWFRSYLKDRKQFVCINNEKSSLRSVDCGVPQGSILGPLLFIIYINDFPKSSNVLSFILFADDSNLFFSHSNPHTLVDVMNIELNKIMQWLRANRLSLNLQKTNVMLFSNTLDKLPHDIIFENEVIKQVYSVRFLGVTVDSKLSWKQHIDCICRTISSNIGVINKVKFCFPVKKLLMLYSTLILPYLTYGIIVWGNTHSTYLDRLFLLQKKSTSSNM